MFAIEASTISGNLITVIVEDSDTIADLKHNITQGDLWKRGTPVIELSPLSVNADLAMLKATGGKLRLCTPHGDMLDDITLAQQACAHHPDESLQCLIKMVLMKGLDEFTPPEQQFMVQIMDMARAKCMHLPSAGSTEDQVWAALDYGEPNIAFFL